MALQHTRDHLQLLQLPGTPDHLILQDLSRYRDFAEHPRLTLFFPNDQQGLELVFQASETNVYTAEDLCLSFPDGVYTANYSVAPHDLVFVCYPFLRTEHFDCQVQSWLRTIEWSIEKWDSPNYQILARIQGLLLGARAEVARNPSKATRYFQLAKRTLPKF